ncbi:MAG TPA: GNAT family N-acetyltransferase [Casimicrobiaceae bacterium]|nr:GNAT family N-acetyltransferase [Casimicrobiaceae bacterium]
MHTVVVRQTTLRRLARGDLEAVVDIDAVSEGRRRHPYFARRLDAAIREPARHVQLAAVEDGEVVGYILARVLEGEFGRDEPALAIEAIGARHDSMGIGIGTRLLAALGEDARRLGIAQFQTQAAWNNHPMLRWLDKNDFAIAASHIVDCPVAGGAYAPPRDAPVSDLLDAAQGVREIDYGRIQDGDFERLARDNAEIRAMAASDLRDVVRIDHAHTGIDRQGYMQRKLAEAMLDSAIRVSLCATLDEAVVGFLMARVDLGDFGRTEPVAVLDTLGVHPEYRHRRIGHALLSQLFVNLGALRIERVETMVAPHDLDLLGFLYATGFVPSQRIPFERSVDGVGAPHRGELA